VVVCKDNIVFAYDHSFVALFVNRLHELVFQHLDEIEDEAHRLGRSPASCGIPPWCGVVARDGRLGIVANGDIVEAVRGGLAATESIERGIEETERMARALVGVGDNARPLWGASTCATKDVKTTHAVRQEAEVDRHTCIWVSRIGDIG